MPNPLIQAVIQGAPVQVGLEGAPIRIEMKAPQGPAGPAGPNSVTSTTTTNFTAGNVLSSNGTTVTSLSRSGIDTRTSFPNTDVTNATTTGAADQLLRLNAGGNAVVNILIATEGVEAGEEGGDSGYFRIINTSGDAVTINNANASNAEVSLPTGSGTLALTSSADGLLSSTDITDASPITASNGGKVLKSTAEGTLESISIVTASSSYLQVGVLGKDGVAAFSSYGNRLDGTAIAEIYMQRSSTAEASIRVDNLTGVREIQFPDASGTLALTSDITDAVTSNTTSDGTCDLDVASLITGSVNFNTAVTSATAGVGELNWNDSDGTLNLGLKGGNVTLQIGQESVARVVNKTGANLLESQYRVVRIRSTAEGGAQGQRLAVVLAQANNDPNSVDTLGLVTENINVNEEGFVTTSGLVRGINTTGSLQGESWVDGDVLYLSPTTAGQLTKVKPQAPQHTVIVGFVVYAHNSQGKIYVKVDNGYELDELHNVRIVDATDGEVLLFNGTENVWQNFMLVPASIGLDQVDNTSDLDKPVSLATYEAISPILQDVPPEDSISVTLTDLGKTLTMYLSSGEITAGFPDYEGNDVDGWYWQLIRYLDSWILSVNDGVDDVYYAEMYYPTPTRFPWDAVVLGSASWNVTIGTTAPSISAPRIGTTVIEPQGTWMFNGKWRLIFDLYNVAVGGYDFLTAPTSGSLYSFLADKTGSGLSVFATSPTITTPTFAGAASFTSTTRPTSSGTGTPASNSLVTRNDVDSRGGRNISVTLSTNEAGNQNTTTLKTATGLQMTLEAGTWDIECLIMVDCNNTTAGSRQKLNFSGTSSSFNGVVYGVDNGATTTTTYPNARAVGSAVNYERVASGASSATIRYARLVATGSGVLSAQFAQAVATASTSPTLLAGSYIRAFKVA